MTTIFVTGGSSRIGQSVIERLTPHARLILLQHRSPVPCTGSEVERVDGGLAEIRRHVDRVRAADTVLHLAGLSRADSDDDYMRVNHEGTEALLRVCRDGQRFVYISSRCVGEAGGGYGRSKQLAEESVRRRGVAYSIIRPAEVYGTSSEGMDALIGLARRHRVLIDLHRSPPITYSPVSHDELAELIARAVTAEYIGDRIYTACNDRDYDAEEIRCALSSGLERRVFKLVVPVSLLRGLQRLGLPLPFKRDQLARLSMPKSSDNSTARADFDFRPECFLDVLRESA